MDEPRTDEHIRMSVDGSRAALALWRKSRAREAPTRAAFHRLIIDLGEEVLALRAEKRAREVSDG